MRSVLLTASLVALALVPAHAHHRQTPPISLITTSGEASLPRLPPPSRKAIAIEIDDGVMVIQPFRNPMATTFAFVGGGTSANPAISSNGKTVAFDSDADPVENGAPGRQIAALSRFVLVAPAVDPTGTSANPTVDLGGVAVAFESTADFAGENAAGARQIFYTSFSGGTPIQLSRGTGTSRHPAVVRRNRTVVFDSTSDPTTGLDTGIAQIWTANLLTGTSGPITSGLGSSEQPSLSNDGRLIVFVSTADLAGDGHDTGVSQVFAYDTKSQTFARITNEPGGCTNASSARIKRDWRIAYMCGGNAYFTMLRAGQRYHVATDGGDTTGLVPQADAHFMLVATTANLTGVGTTPEHRVYMVNLFSRPPSTVAGSVTWFPFQGIPPL